MGSDGFISCEEIVAFMVRNKFPDTTFETIYSVVASCPKRRFELSEDRMSVRACQGHSIAVIADEELLIPIDSLSIPDVVVHGTVLKNWESIKVFFRCRDQKVK